jgi:hypothetical protein
VIFRSLDRAARGNYQGWVSGYPLPNALPHEGEGAMETAVFLVSVGQNVGNGLPHLLRLRAIRATLGSPRRV